jgi:hypothetical protein
MKQATRLIAILALICAHSSIFADQGQPSQKPAAAEATPANAPATQAPKPVGRNDIRVASLTGFSVDHPKKDWQALYGSGSALLVLFHKNREVTVAIERTTVVNALSAKEITDRTAKLEVDDWAMRRPLASGFAPQLINHEGERLIVIDFNQPGPRGPERVRMYTLPRGHDWFRVICTTTPATYEKYLDTCHKIALSLTPALR